jgi:hypothetical protein
MKAHGNFSLQIEEYVVQAHLSDGFNEFGIIEYRESILNIVNNEIAWTLNNNITESAGLTPEALKELIITYKAFEKSGCIAISVMKGANNYFGDLLVTRVFDHINIPTIVSVEQTKILAFLSFHISRTINRTAYRTF